MDLFHILLTYQTKVFTKPTNTQLILNYNCTTPIKYKTMALRTLLLRAFTLSSTWILPHNEFIRLKDLFAKN